MSVLKVLDRIQALSPCAAVQYRIKRILRQDIGSDLFDAFYSSKWVELLKANQLEDGGFGRFHSRDSKKKQKFPTTELAVDSMKMLGIPRGNPMADKLCDYMEQLLRREIEWPDGFEKNKWYRPAQPLFVASKLSVFGSDCRAYLEIFNSWHAILKEAFADGEYNAERTDRISRELLGCDIDRSYIGLNSIYPIELFGNMQAEISDALKHNYLKWLHRSGKPILYTSVVLDQGLNNSFSGLYRVYLLLSGFSCFKTEFEEELSQLIDKRKQDGFWNFGKDFDCQRLSEDWKSQIRMDIDHTILALLLYAS
jgi:hypothetical protein